MDDSLKFSTVGMWTYRQQHDKWVTGKWTAERMRINTDGVIIYHENPIEYLCSELYTFDTKWAAKSHARFCNKLDRVLQEVYRPQGDAIQFTQLLTVTGKVLLVGNSILEVPHSSHRDFRMLAQYSPTGELEWVNLPHLVWLWLRRTWLVRGLKAFWYGWGK